jgi:ribosome-associated protein
MTCPEPANGRKLLAGRQGGELQGDTLAHKIIDALSEHQAEDILLLDIRNVASFADYFVIASAASARQMDAIILSVERAMEREQIRPLGREGEAESGWVLMDYGDVIVHLFAPEERAYYDLEGLWAEATPVVRIQ